MEEPEKLAALKKAYADIILNTAKEAAARIMVSERKAFSFQQELFTAKEDSLNMLLRLKQMTDFKIAEVETTSFSQRRRIEELEAELRKAEDTVADLRSQLKVVQDELEKMKNNHIQPLDEDIVKERAPSHEDVNEQNTSDSGPKSTSTSDTKDTPLNQRNVDENGCANNPELASVIMRSKDPELYRNGCTQRIRAFERNLLNGESPLLAKTDNKYTHIKNESVTKEEEINEVGGIQLSSKDENAGTVKKKPIGLEELLQQDNSGENGQSVKFFRRFSSRKRSRYRTARVTSCTGQVTRPSEPSNLLHCKTYPCAENTIVGHEGMSRVAEDGAKKTSNSHLTSTSSLNTNDVTGSDTNIKALSVQNSVDEVKTLIDKSEFRRQESEDADSPRVSNCELDLNNVDVPSINCNPEEKKSCEATNALPSPAGNGKLLMYTFRRKRKKEPLNCGIDNKTIEKNTAKRRSGEKQTVAPEPPKSSLIIESSRDSRRLVQVARQLISLSEKRWW